MSKSRKKTVANDKRQQIAELRLDMRASLEEERGMVRQKPLAVNRFFGFGGGGSGGTYNLQYESRPA
jgi:hypothetical protein